MHEPSSTKACPRCAHENPPDMKFCGSCGLQIDGLCPICGTQNEHSSHFCGNCGHDFTEPTASGPTPEAQQADAGASSEEANAKEASMQSAGRWAGDLRQQRFTPASEAQPTTAPRGIDCPRCHHTNEPGARFCYNCGLPFDSAAGVEQWHGGQSIPAYVGAKPGGFWVRFVAAILDSIVTTAITSFIILAFTDLSPNQYFTDPEASAGAAEYFIWLLNIFYAPVLLGAWATTVGKRAFSLYVTRPDGSRIGFWRAFGREVAKFISALPLGAGFWMVAFREDKRGLHDLIADTVVVQR